MPPPEKKGLSDFLDGVQEGAEQQPVYGTGTDLSSVPAETKLDTGNLGFMESLKRPGFGNNWGADLTKILTQVGADSLGGGPAGGLMSSLGIMANPDSLRPAAKDYGPMTGPALGNPISAITGKIDKIPFLNKLPGLLQGTLSGAAQGAADSEAQGINPALGGAVGGAAGMGGGMLSKYLQGVASKTPTAVAHDIEGSASALTGPRAPNVARTLQRVEENFAQFPDVSKSQEALLAGQQKQTSLQGLLTDFSKQQKTAKTSLSTAASKRRTAIAKLAQEKARVEDETVRRVAKAQDFLQTDYPAAKTKIDAELAEITEKKKLNSSGTLGLTETDPAALDAQEAAAISRNLDLERRKELSEQMTRVEGKMDAKQMQRLGETSDPNVLKAQKELEEATNRRSEARKLYQTAQKNLGGVEKEIRNIKTDIDANEKFIQPFIAATGLDPARMTPASRAALAVATKNPVTAKGIIHNVLYNSKGPASELGDPTLAKGLREALEHDPEATSALRSEFLREILDRHRLQSGGNQPGTSKVFSGADFQKHVNQFDSKALNEFFGDQNGPSKTAADIIKGLGASAARADEFVEAQMPKLRASLTTGGGLVFLAGSHIYGGSVQSGMQLLGLASVAAPLIDYKHIIGNLLKLPDARGRAVAAFLNAKNPEMLPHNIVTEASKTLSAAFGEKKPGNTPESQEDQLR